MADSPIQVGTCSSTWGGVAPSLLGGTPRFPLGVGLGLAGAAPTVTGGAVSAREAQPVSWSGLGAGAAGAAVGPLAWKQWRATAAGVFSNAAALFQGSNDQSNWTTLGSLTAPGSIVLSMADLWQGGYRYARVAIQGGDGGTNISVAGSISVTGCT
jgi:hypothetical protein